MKTHSLKPIPLGSCFVDAMNAQRHTKVPSALRAPLQGHNLWRVGHPESSQDFMERRGWLQPVCLAVTTPEQILEASSSYERLYIPGEFCRQGDVLSAAAETGKMIFLERGAFLAPSDIVRAVDKLGDARERVILVEAGSSFGYSDRVLDPRALAIMEQTGCPIALNLNPLTAAVGAAYEHRPNWLGNDHFDIAFVRTAIAFGVRFLVLPSQRELNTEALELWIASQKDNT
ncbi:MAG: hypothetical protein RI932_109 [Pseudomonadota bacterium]